jgi:hypothetical protein
MQRRVTAKSGTAVCFLVVSSTVYDAVVWKSTLQEHIWVQSATILVLNGDLRRLPVRERKSFSSPIPAMHGFSLNLLYFIYLDLS